MTTRTLPLALPIPLSVAAKPSALHAPAASEAGVSSSGSPSASYNPLSDSENAGRHPTSPRCFSNFATGKIITE